MLHAGVEGTASYGSALNRILNREDVTVIEVNRPERADRRRRGKTDATDAEAVARAVLSGRANALAKAGDGPVEMAACSSWPSPPPSSPAPRQSTSSRPCRRVSMEPLLRATWGLTRSGHFG